MGLGFVGRTISVTTTQLCGCRVKAAIEPVSGGGPVPRPRSQRPDTGRVWSAGHSLTPCSKRGTISIKGIKSTLVQNVMLQKWGNESMPSAVLCSKATHF